MMQSYLIGRELACHVIFDTDIVIQPRRSFLNECAFPADIQVAAFTEGPADYPCLKAAGAGLDDELLFPETDIRHPHGFIYFYSGSSGDPCQRSIDLIPADTESP
jgi:hypothetical protein